LQHIGCGPERLTTIDCTSALSVLQDMTVVEDIITIDLGLRSIGWANIVTIMLHCEITYMMPVRLLRNTSSNKFEQH